MSKISLLRKNIPIKGMNTVMPKRNFSDDFSPGILNCWYDDGVTLRRRLCIAAVSSAQIIAGTKGLFEYKDVTKQIFVHDALGALSKLVPPVAAIAGAFGGIFTPVNALSGVVTTNTVIPINAAYAGAIPPVPVIVTAANTPIVGQTTITTTIAATKTLAGRTSVSVYSASLPITFTGKLRSVKLGKMMLFSDGIAALKYDGVLFSPIVKPPTLAGGVATIGNILHVHMGRVYAAGDPARPLTVDISDTVTSSGVDYWGYPPASPVGEQGGFLDCSADLGQGDVITGLTTHRGLLVVLCRNHILFYVVSEKISGVAFSLFKIVGGEGCVTQDSIQQVGEDVLFLSPNGFKKLSVSLVQGDSQVNDLSQPINNVIKEKLRNPAIAPLNMSSTYNARYGLYMMSFGDGDVWVMQPAFDGWFKWNGLTGKLFTDSDLITYHSTTILNELSNKVFQDGTLAAPRPVTMSWELPQFRYGEDSKVRWNRIEVIIESTATSIIKVTHTSDMKDISARSNLITVPIVLAPQFATLIKEGTVRLPIAARSEILSIVISNSDGHDVRFKVVELYYNAGNIRE